MSTRKRPAAKKKGESEEARAERRRLLLEKHQARKYDEPTVTFFQYAPASDLVRVNIVQDAEFLGEERRYGVDRDIPLDELSDDIRQTLSDLLGTLADHVGATSFDD